ncbi:MULTISPECIES: phage minor head protein [Pseudomonas]|uniref:phage minor head protein n=1 Tax=Pseudomonas TaxID=286 RepID=UPI0030025308
MPTVNEQLQSATIDHQIDLQHLSNAEVRKIIKLLNRADKDLAAQLYAAIEEMEPDRYTNQYMLTVLKSVRELNKQVYESIAETLTTDLSDLVEYEAGYQLKLFNATVPTPVLSRVPLVAVTLPQVRAIAMSRPFQGRLLKEWLTGVEEGRAVLIRDAIRVGMIEGQTTAQIVQRIIGNKSNGYADGLIDRSRRDVETMVRTAVSHVANTARDSFYQANEGLVKGVQWLSTLDSKTSPPCRIRDNLKYTVDTHKPIGHSVPWLAGPGRLHFNCRSTSTPILKSWRELGIDADDLDAGTRASMDGQVPADMSYGEWLSKQSAARQDQVLGPTRGRLLRQGGLSPDKFYNDKGRYLSIDELRDKDAAAFDKAGL